MSAHDTPSVRRHQDRLAAEGIDVVRVTYPDLIGTDRARDVLLDHLPSACEHGLAFCRAVYHTTPRGDVVAIEGGIDAGLPDISVRPDLSTLARVPWEPGVAWCLGDTTDPATGGPAAESPRDLLRSVLARCTDAGLSPVVGPELEYFLLEEDATAPNGWRRSPTVTGSVYTAGLRADPDNHLLRTLRQLRDLGLGVITGNHEFDGGQYEINLTHSDALDAADRAFRFKAAVKELARKEGKLATFMAKPFNDSGGSGFHLHFSCVDADGRNVFDDPAGAFGLSGNARHAIAGILAHAPALAALLNPTVNSYKRFGPDTLAPWLINWGLDNRSAMVRIPPERGSGARLEVRLGDAGANPYLAIAALTAAALLGVQEGKEPPAPLEGYGYDPEKSQVLPMNLTAALDALEADEALIELLGKDFTASFLAYKRDEAERFQRHVTDWEFAEYSYHL
ncbi:glutamine synthetase family protein [Streptomyces sp. NBC_00078]|uniref:glutamine synthetase family protein n=1 Tax=unclassified Streptomyces TaxID=2593676 RepID=UPI00224CA2EF|nr:glutamine synthetase family protein [Streptomyces sp. NBC_00078]MCX5424368.1 glutamine synthetase family protein [Streptomyces sp. NBC_00078]